MPVITSTDNSVRLLAESDNIAEERENSSSLLHNIDSVNPSLVTRLRRFFLPETKQDEAIELESLEDGREIRLMVADELERRRQVCATQTCRIGAITTAGALITAGIYAASRFMHTGNMPTAPNATAGSLLPAEEPRSEASSGSARMCFRGGGILPLPGSEMLPCVEVQPGPEECVQDVNYYVRLWLGLDVDCSSTVEEPEQPIEVVRPPEVTTTKTTTPTTTTTFPPTVKPKVRQKNGSRNKTPYYVRDVENPICLHTDTIERCEKIHLKRRKRVPALAIRIEDKICFCPPPPGYKKYYNVINVIDKTENKAPDKPVVVLKRGLPEIHGAPPSRTNTSAIVQDDVKITKLFDLTCIEARNNLDMADRMRIVGDALSNPTSSFAKEVAVVKAHREHRGCPSKEELEEIEKVASVADFILSSVLTLLPGSKALDVAQNIIGPVLQMIADEMQGKPINPEKQKALTQAVVFMIQQLSHTLTPAEQAPLYSQKINSAEVIGKGKKTLTQRFSLQDEKLWIKSGTKKYELRETTDHVPFVIDDSGRYRFVRYNQQTQNWDIVDEANNHAYTRENIECIENYRIPPDKWPKDHIVTVDKKSYSEICTPGKPGVGGVFMGDSFIPAWWDAHGEHLLTSTNSQTQDSQRVIIYTPYGWEFEPASERMDDNLKLLLESDDKGIDYLRTDRIYPISADDDIAPSDYDGMLIKKDYKYYKIKSSYNYNKRSYEATLDDYANAIIKHENGIFKLASADDFIFPFDIYGERGVLNKDIVAYYEKNLLEYLLYHGKTVPESPVRSVDNAPGLYVDKNGHGIFIIDGAKYSVNKHIDREIHLERSDDTKNNIILINDDGVYIRRRDKVIEESDSYKEIGDCRTKRNGQGAACQRVVVEPELNQLLMRYISEERCIDRKSVPQNLVVSSKIALPDLFWDEKSTRYYFKYGEQYFDAKLIEANDKNNPTWLPAIKIYVKDSFIRRSKVAETVVIEKKDNRIELKSVGAFVSEKFNIDKKIAENYVKKRRYRDEQHMGEVDSLINEVKLSGRALFIQYEGRPSWMGGRVSLNTQKNKARDVLFPPRIKDNKDLEIKYIKLDDTTNALDSYEQAAVKTVKDKLQYVKGDVLLTAIDSLHYNALFWSDYNAYAGDVLKSSSVEFLSDVAVSLRKNLQNIQDSIIDKNVYLVTAVKKAKDSARSESLLTPAEMSSGKVVYVENDADGKVFINIDKIVSDDDVHNIPMTDLIGDIIRAGAESSLTITDLDEVGKVNGMYIPVMDALEDFIDKIESQRLSPSQTNNVIEITKKYLQAHPVYKDSMSEFIAPRKIAYLAHNDPGFRAHLLTNSPDLIAILAMDIFFNRSVNELPPAKVDAWMKRYSEARGISRVGVNNPPISTSEINISALTKKIPSRDNVREVSENPNIYYTVPELELLIKVDDDYYPAEFVGKSGKVVIIGGQSEVRQAYYYNQRRGIIRPIQEMSTSSHSLVYNRDLDLYEQKNTATGESSVLAFDSEAEKLVDTGSSRIVSMAGGVSRLMFPQYDLFYPQGAPAKVYLAAHASRKLGLGSRKRLPQNVEAHFYTQSWSVLKGHVDDLEKLVHDEFTATQTVQGGKEVESYKVILDKDSQINYHDLSQESNRCLVRIHAADEIDTSQLSQIISKLFAPKKVELHLYICRSVK